MQYVDYHETNKQSKSFEGIDLFHSKGNLIHEGYILLQNLPFAFAMVNALDFKEKASTSKYLLVGSEKFEIKVEFYHLPRLFRNELVQSYFVTVCQQSY
jgi:hypothetical protein